jgi:AcrR family transcriptional regulator
MKRYTRNILEKKKLIYKAFSELLNEVGYDGVTTRNIAKKAGVSIGTIYHHFKEGKVSIAAGLFEENLSRQIGSVGMDLRTQISSTLKLHREHLELYRAFDQAIYARQDIFASIKKKRNLVIERKLEGTDVDVATFYRINSTVEAVLHRHLFIEPMFDTDEALVDYLVVLAGVAYNYN